MYSNLTKDEPLLSSTSYVWIAGRKLCFDSMQYVLNYRYYRYRYIR